MSSLHDAFGVEAVRESLLRCAIQPVLVYAATIENRNRRELFLSAPSLHLTMSSAGQGGVVLLCLHEVSSLGG